jgi:hypothetical protein
MKHFAINSSLEKRGIAKNADKNGKNSIISTPLKTS